MCPVADLRNYAAHAGARAFALPVRARAFGLEPEGLGMVFAEAAACGVPVLAGRSGGTLQTLIEGVTGWTINPRDVASWARALRWVLLNVDEAAQLGAAGRELIKRRYDTSVILISVPLATCSYVNSHTR